MSCAQGTLVQAFWHGDPLSPLHFAALSSFVANGHRLHLYAYENLQVPVGVTLMSADEVLPRDNLFYFTNPQTETPDLGPFSDLFRFKLLLAKGGWYIDVDTFCLSANIPQFVHAWARENPLMNPSAVGTSQISFPAGGELVRQLAEASEAAARGFYQREALGPHLISRLVSQARLPTDMNGNSASFYPVPWIETFKLWLPEFCEELRKKCEGAMFLPYYQSLPRYMGFLDKGAPPRGSLLRELVDLYAPGAMAKIVELSADDLRKSVRGWFATNAHFKVAEYQRITGHDPFDDLGGGGISKPAQNENVQENASNEKEQQEMTSGLEGIVAKIDESIIGLFRERERLVSTMGKATAQKSSLAPFIVPFALGETRRVRPFEELAPGFWFGYPAEVPAVVDVVQNVEANYLLSPPDHHFTVTFTVEDPAGAAWMTVEKRADMLDAQTSYRVTIALKARASIIAPVRFELSVPQVTGEDHRFQLGTVTLSRNFDAVFLSQVIDTADVPAMDHSQPSKIVAFVPPEVGLELTLAYYSTLVAPQ